MQYATNGGISYMLLIGLFVLTSLGKKSLVLFSPPKMVSLGLVEVCILIEARHKCLLLVVWNNVFPGYEEKRKAVWHLSGKIAAHLNELLNVMSLLVLCSFPAGLSCLWVCKCIHTEEF